MSETDSAGNKNSGQTTERESERNNKTIHDVREWFDYQDLPPAEKQPSVVRRFPGGEKLLNDPTGEDPYTIQEDILVHDILEVFTPLAEKNSQHYFQVMEVDRGAVEEIRMLGNPTRIMNAVSLAEEGEDSPYSFLHDDPEDRFGEIEG